MAFTWDDRFDAKPGTFDPRFQGGETTSSSLTIGTLTMVGVVINSRAACSYVTNLTIYRSEIGSVSVY